MSVPETSMYKDGNFFSGEVNVGGARHQLIVNTISIACSMKQGAYAEFGLGIVAPDLGHVLTAYL